MDELGQALLGFDDDDGIGAIVITGSDKAFAAGADIGAMKDWTYMDVYRSEYISRNWETIKRVRKPVIAAVSGYALGGGCELVMMCDIVIAADTARFGQPEIKLGIIPGAGATQRLPRAIGKAKAMDLILSARMMDAAEAERAGLVSRVVPAAGPRRSDQVGETIASFSLPSVMMAKESLKRAFEAPLEKGCCSSGACSIRCSRRRPEGRHGGVHREAGAWLQAPLEARSNRTSDQVQTWLPQEPSRDLRIDQRH